MSRTFPPWLKKRIPAEGTTETVRALLEELRLTTVCQNARCPNIMECFTRKTATFMIMGNVCSRHCGFCAVSHGETKPLDPAEPRHVAEAVSRLKLRHAVITSVTRDDLPDGGAGHFAATIRAIKARTPHVIVEVLIPDFQGDFQQLKTVVDAGAEVVAHNIETVRRLTPKVRDRRAQYAQSLKVLADVHRINAGTFTKTSIMVGLGETDDEVGETLADLRAVGCQVVTFGQYLRPTPRHLKVEAYIPPEQFATYQRWAEEAGFLYCASGPLVRSSYKAGEFFIKGILEKQGRLERPTKLFPLADTSAKQR